MNANTEIQLYVSYIIRKDSCIDYPQAIIDHFIEPFAKNFEACLSNGDRQMKSIDIKRRDLKEKIVILGCLWSRYGFPALHFYT